MWGDASNAELKDINVISLWWNSVFHWKAKGRDMVWMGCAGHLIYHFMTVGEKKIAQESIKKGHIKWSEVTKVLTNDSHIRSKISSIIAAALKIPGSQADLPKLSWEMGSWDTSLQAENWRWELPVQENTDCWGGWNSPTAWTTLRAAQDQQSRVL